MKKELMLVKIKSDYCDYLRKYDPLVPYNMDKKSTRPFVGALFKIDKCLYFAPLASPKPKHLTMNEYIDFMKIDDGKLGGINLNNMIPVKKENVIKIEINDNFSAISKYNKLLAQQYRWLSRNDEILYKRARKLYDRCVSNRINRKIKERCCNFKLLEEKCKEYIEEVINN